MFSDLEFDELNKLIPNKRSLPFEQYFGEMKLSEEEIKKRIELAEKLENEFLYILALAFTMQQYNVVDWEMVRQEYESRYLLALGSLVVATPYIQNYVRSMSYDIVEATQRHQSEYYYYSPDRARYMAECESNTTRSYQCNEDAIAEGKTMKRWMTMGDKRVRTTHKEVGGTSKPIGKPFYVGGSLLLYPRDSSLGAASSEIVGCRCSIEYY